VARAEHNAEDADSVFPRETTTFWVSQGNKDDHQRKYSRRHKGIDRQSTREDSQVMRLVRTRRQWPVSERHAAPHTPCLTAVSIARTALRVNGGRRSMCQERPDCSTLDKYMVLECDEYYHRDREGYVRKNR
jgi:hypothetical protein